MRTIPRLSSLFAFVLGPALLARVPCVAQNPPSPQAEPAISSPSAPAPIAPQPMASEVAAPRPSTAAPSAPKPMVGTPMVSTVADPAPPTAEPAAPKPVAPSVPASYASTATARAASPPAAVAASAVAASKPEGPLDAARPRLSNALNRIEAVRAIVDDRLRSKAITTPQAKRVRALLARQEKDAVKKAGTGDLSPGAARTLNRTLDRLVLRLSPPKPAP